MDLNAKVWKELDGGYRQNYDASIVLKALKSSREPEETKKLLDELWDNLHHQGDVGLASYLSVPQLILICIEKHSLDSKFIGLVMLIEQCRLLGTNPELPAEFEIEYFTSLANFEQYLLINFKSIYEPESVQNTLALLATLNGLPDLGRILAFLDEDSIEKFAGDNC
jgi:hypothetical protein